MAQRVILAYRLRPEVGRDEYERWVREQDVPYVRSRPTVQHFEVMRVDGALEGAAGMEYVEVLEITDLDADRALLAQPPGPELDGAWRSMTRDQTILRVTRIAGSKPSDEDAAGAADASRVGP